MDETFGSFIMAKRQGKNLTIRKFAWLLDLSPTYINSIEKDRKSAPRGEVLDKIILTLGLSQADITRMYDLAAKSKNSDSVSRDLPEYIMEKDIVRVALRTAIDVGAADEDWLAFIEKLKRRST